MATKNAQSRTSDSKRKVTFRNFFNYSYLQFNGYLTITKYCLQLQRLTSKSLRYQLQASAQHLMHQKPKSELSTQDLTSTAWFLMFIASMTSINWLLLKHQIINLISTSYTLTTLTTMTSSHISQSNTEKWFPENRCLTIQL